MLKLKKKKKPLFLLLLVLTCRKSLICWFVRPKEPTNQCYVLATHMSHLEENARKANETRWNEAAWEYTTQSNEANQVEKQQIRIHAHIQAEPRNRKD